MAVDFILCSLGSHVDRSQDRLTDHFLSIRWQFEVKGNSTGQPSKTCTCVFMTSTQKKTWIGDLTALVTLSNILIKQVEAKKSMFKKNWFQANGYEQEKALLIFLLSKTEALKVQSKRQWIELWRWSWSSLECHYSLKRTIFNLFTAQCAQYRVMNIQ